MVHDHVCNGCDTLERSDNAVDDGTALVLNAGADELAWGIWGWDASGDDLLSLSYDFDIPAGQQVYAAIADFLAQRWEIHGPLTDDEQFALDDTRHKSPTGMVYCAALAYDGNTPSVLTLTLTVDGNLPPVADLTADVTAGDPSFDVHFDASGSSDPDGSIAGYEWDCDGDGVFSETGQEADALDSPTAVYTYSQADIYHACVRVTDDGGGTDTATLDIKARGWKIVTLASIERSHDFWNHGISLAPVDGCPAISFAERDALFGGSGVWYAISGTPYGTSARDWQTLQLAPQGSVVSLKVIGGRPAIACDQNQDLLYLHSTTARGETLADWQQVVIDQSRSGPLLAVVDGRPAITYTKTTDMKYVMRYAISSTAFGDSATDWHCITLPTENSPYRLSLALIDGKPAIAWESWLNDLTTLNYYYASTPDGGIVSDWQNVLIDQSDSTSRYSCSLAQIAGQPAIAYSLNVIPNGGGLYYAVSSTARGGSAGDWTKLTVEEGVLFDSVSLAEMGGMPVITSAPSDTGVLRFSISSTSDGADPADWASATVDPSEVSGEVNSLALINGCPAIAYSYSDWSGVHMLRYAILLQ